jgi:hypothetical protein
MPSNTPRNRPRQSAPGEKQPITRGSFHYREDGEYSASGRSEEQEKLPEGMAEAYQLKLMLEGSKPPIWRRLVVPAAISLDALHAVIQIVMEWDNDHLHQFRVGTRKDGDLTTFSVPGMIEDAVNLDEAKARLDALLVRPKDKLRYLYDFGDSWLHSLVLETILVLPSEEAAVPRCVTGERASPLEDSGGLWGWERVCTALADPSDPDADDLLEGLDPDFDPEAFDVEAINSALKKRFAPKRRRGKAKAMTHAKQVPVTPVSPEAIEGANATPESTDGLLGRSQNKQQRKSGVANEPDGLKRVE